MIKQGAACVYLTTACLSSLVNQDKHDGRVSSVLLVAGHGADDGQRC